MNPIDLAILLVIALSALLGLVRGMLTEVLSLLVWIAAVILAIVLGDEVAPRLSGIESPLLRSVAAHAGVFVLVLLVGNLLVWLLRSLFHGIGLSLPDRLLGAGFGALRGYAVVLVGVLAAGFTPWVEGAAWRESRLLPLWEGPGLWLRANWPERSSLVAFFDALEALDPLDADPASAPPPESP
jgi:membrane protein required for colicin V production